MTVSLRSENYSDKIVRLRICGHALRSSVFCLVSIQQLCCFKMYNMRLAAKTDEIKISRSELVCLISTKKRTATVLKSDKFDQL